MKMLDIIKNGIGYVTITYPDSSKRVVKTTLNPNILLKEGVTYKEGHLYDLEHKEFVKYSLDCKIDISEDEPKLEGVDEFAHRFI